MTYSIVARDPASGRFGVAVQSCWPFVGLGCPWVESGVGAVVTQSFTEVAHGPNGLERLRAGGAASDVLAELMAGDAEREVRQVGIVDATGRTAAFTGSRCVEASGDVTADGVSAQANVMERPTVWPAMIAAWTASRAGFAERLLAALCAAEAEGGDHRGRQSAVIVISGPPGAPAWERDVDIRVDDHPAPLDEVERLLTLHRGYAALDRAERLGAAGDGVGAAAASAEAARLALAIRRSRSGRRSAWRRWGGWPRPASCWPRQRGRTRAGRRSSSGSPRRGLSPPLPSPPGGCSATDGALSSGGADDAGNDEAAPE